MILTPLENLLLKLQDELNITLHIDTTKGLSILIDKKLKMQLALDKTEQFLYLIAYLAPLPAGKFREKMLFEALKVNNRYPRNFSLAYVDRINQLVAFSLSPIENLDGKTFKNLIFSLADYAFLWVKAFEANLAVPPELAKQEKGKPPGIFGLK